MWTKGQKLFANKPNKPRKYNTFYIYTFLICFLLRL